MGSHPINLIFRFLLEIVALFAFGFWGWTLSHGWSKLVLALGIPIILAVVWGVFAVPGDPSRSGLAPVAIPGFLRVILELAFFSFAYWCIKEIGYGKLSLLFGILVLLHYILSLDRLKWLFSQ